MPAPRVIRMARDPEGMVKQWGRLTAKANPEGPRERALATGKIAELVEEHGWNWRFQRPEEKPEMFIGLGRELRDLGAVAGPGHPLEGKL